MVAKIAGKDVTTKKENATTAALTVTAAKKKDLEMDAMAPLEEKPDTDVFWNQVVVPLNAKIRNLQVGTIDGVNYVKNMSYLGIIVIKRGGSTAIIKSVENFVKSHVTNANHLKI